MDQMHELMSLDPYRVPILIEGLRRVHFAPVSVLPAIYVGTLDVEDLRSLDDRITCEAWAVDTTEFKV